MRESSSGAIKGIAVLNVGLVLFVIHDAVSKALMAHYPLFQVIFIRSVIALPLVLFMVRLQQGNLRLRSKRMGGLFLRGLLSVGAFVFFLIGLKVMPLTETFALFISSPLLVAALAGPMLGEPATGRQWVAVLLGFGAVLFIIRPGSSVPMLGALAMTLSVICFSVSIILTRRLGRTESASLITVYVMLTFVLVSGIISPIGWVVPTTGDFLLMATIGVIASVAMFCTITAYKNVTPPLAAPFQYVQLVWAMIIGFFVWGDVPEPSIIMAAAVIVVAGVYVLRVEGSH